MNFISSAIKYTSGAAAAGASSLMSDAMIVDLMVAGLGGFTAMAAGKTFTGRLWEGLIGLAMGVAIALLMRSGEFNDLIIRIAIFIGAILGTKIVEFVRSPEGLSAIGTWLKRLLTAAVGR